MGNESKVRGHIKALNEQFADWIQKQRVSNSHGVWTSACKDYIKYVSELEKELSSSGGDLSTVSNNIAGGTAAGCQLFMFGTGDCGQLGLGEDVPELPFPKQINFTKLPVSALLVFQTSSFPSFFLSCWKG